MTRLLTLSLPLLLTFAGVAAEPDPRVIADEHNRIRPVPVEVDGKLINPWPDGAVEALRDRTDYAIRAHGNRISGNTYFENEKSYYPTAMLTFLHGDRDRAVRVFQEEDNNRGWHSHTEGIDFFPSFTLKNQVRKYFFFGQYLDPAYRQRMFEGAKKWTAEDPYRRSHHAFEGGGPGWTPQVHNSWVDIRNTDNLRAMRETSIYLFAEETGNDAVAEQYLEKIERYVWALWHIGMGEWDSENYHFHTITAYLNLYDFARNERAKTLAKAALDMLFTRAAVKYFNGGWSGAIKRDYNKPYVFGGAAGEAWLYFADAGDARPHPHYDYAHTVTSAYRPPYVVVQLARNNIEPTELLLTHPPYETWKVEGTSGAGKDYPAENYPRADHEPAFHEILHMTRSYQVGTLPRGSHGDVNGFKLLMRDSGNGAQFFTAASVDKAAKVNRGSGQDRIGHYRNLIINVTRNANAKWAFLLPAGAAIESSEGVTFLKTDSTWLAITPIHLELGQPDGQQVKNWKHTQSMEAEGTGGPLSGFVLEIGDAESHESFEKFMRAVLDQSKLELKDAEQGVVTYAGSRGKTVTLDVSGGGLPELFRDGRLHDWSKHKALYQPADGGKAPISLGWKQGKLHIEAGGHTFDATFTDDGDYTWNSGAK